MQVFNSGVFWFCEGILFCVMLVGFKYWTEDRAIPTPWWKWAAVLLWVLLVGFTIAFVGTSLGEGEPTAAVRGGLLFGFLSVLSGVAVWRVLLIGTERALPKDVQA